MKTWKKGLAAMATAALLAGVFAGCGKAILMKQQVQATPLNWGLLPLIPAQALPMSGNEGWCGSGR